MISPAVQCECRILWSFSDIRAYLGAYTWTKEKLAANGFISVGSPRPGPGDKSLELSMDN